MEKLERSFRKDSGHKRDPKNSVYGHQKTRFERGNPGSDMENQVQPKDSDPRKMLDHTYTYSKRKTFF
jgi:hypothetical protein